MSKHLSLKVSHRSFNQHSKPFLCFRAKSIYSSQSFLSSSFSTKETLMSSVPIDGRYYDQVNSVREYLSVCSIKSQLNSVEAKWKTYTRENSIAEKPSDNQFLMNIAFMLQMKQFNENVLIQEINKIEKLLEDLTKKTESFSIYTISNSIKQNTTTNFGSEFLLYSARIKRLARTLQAYQDYAICSRYKSLGTAEFSMGYGLSLTPTARDALSEHFLTLASLGTTLISLSRDIWGYISLRYFKLKVKAQEVGSSTMPHKVNPIDFENAEGNLGIANAFFTVLSDRLLHSRFQGDFPEHSVYENAGSGYAYLILSLKSLEKGFGKIDVNEEVLDRI